MKKFLPFLFLPSLALGQLITSGGSGGGGSGTVTSVAQTAPAFLTVAGSPVTTTGTLALTLSGTALPVTSGGTGITSLGTGIATWWGTPSSANLRAALTDENGTGAALFAGATSPDFTTSVTVAGTALAKSGSNSDITALTGLTASSTLTLAPAANTVADGFALTDTTAASSGNQQFSPALHFTGQGWKTTATAASQAVDFRVYAKPVQGTANPTANWTLETSVNAAAYAPVLEVTNAGSFGIAIPGNTSGRQAYMFEPSSAGNFALRRYTDAWAAASSTIFKVDNSTTTDTFHVTAGTFSLDSGVNFVGVPATPAQITADQNNYSIGTAGYYIRLNSDASRTLTGMVTTTAQTTGQTHVLINVGSNNIIISNENASSTAANRFHNSGGADITLAADNEVNCWYDGTTARWRVTKRGF